ncbi:MAG: hypothetical protein ACLGIZ_13950 [Acidimicrobiia bacterium]
MNRTVVTAGVILAAALAVRRLARSFSNVDWEKKLSAMPDTAPPKWMFANIKAIRDNTDRILELLQEEHHSG